MAKFTAGPWKYTNGDVVDSSNTKISVSGVSMPCGYVPSEHESYANARLIAAAPDLYEALRRFVEHYGDPAGGKIFGARAALRKADGEDPA